MKSGTFLAVQWLRLYASNANGGELRSHMWYDVAKKIWKKKRCLTKWNYVICNNMHELGGHYHKQNNPDREQQISHGNSHMRNLKRKKNQTQIQRIEKCFLNCGEIGRKNCKKGYKFSVTRWLRSEDLMYTMVTTVDNVVLYNWNLLGEENLNVLTKK